MSVKLMIYKTIEEIAAQENKTLKPLSDDVVLLESGLDSLCFAILVARLEDELGIDPFSSSEEVYFPVTLGDFISCYDHAVAA